MIDPERKARRQRLARSVLARHAGPSVDTTAVAAAAERAYDELARVLAPVIGGVGVAAMTDRALHLAKREYPWLPSSEPGTPDTRFTTVIDALKQQDDPAVAAEAGAAVFEGHPWLARHVHWGTVSGATGVAGVARRRFQHRHRGDMNAWPTT